MAALEPPHCREFREHESCAGRYLAIVDGREYRLVVAVSWLIQVAWAVYNESFPLFAKATVAHKRRAGWADSRGRSGWCSRCLNLGP